MFNGLLLAPNLDALFDKGFITVADDGSVVVSGRLPAEARTALGLGSDICIGRLAGGHRGYLPWHRAKVFKK